MYQQLQREGLSGRKFLYIESKEMNVSIRRKDYPVSEDAESKGPLPVPVNAEFFSDIVAIFAFKVFVFRKYQA